MGQGEFLDKAAYSHLWDFGLWFFKVAAADAGEVHTGLSRQDTGGSDAFCLRATPVLDRKIHKYT